MDFVQKEVSQVLGPPTSFALLLPPAPPTWDPAQEGGGEGSGGLSIPTWLAKLGAEGGPWTATKGGDARACLAQNILALPIPFQLHKPSPSGKKKRTRSEGATNHVAESQGAPLQWAKNLV